MNITFKEFAQMVQDMRQLQNKARAIPRSERKSKDYWMRRVTTKTRDVDALLAKILGGQSELFGGTPEIEDEVIEFNDEILF